MIWLRFDIVGPRVQGTRSRQARPVFSLTEPKIYFMSDRKLVYLSHNPTGLEQHAMNRPNGHSHPDLKAYLSFSRLFGGNVHINCSSPGHYDGLDALHILKHLLSEPELWRIWTSLPTFRLWFLLQALCLTLLIPSLKTWWSLSQV